MNGFEIFIISVKVEAMQSGVSQMGGFFYMCFPSVNNIFSKVTKVEEITLPALVSYGLQIYKDNLTLSKGWIS